MSINANRAEYSVHHIWKGAQDLVTNTCLTLTLSYKITVDFWLFYLV